MSSESQNKRILVRAEPISKDLYSLAAEFDSFFVTECKVHKETLPITFSLSKMLVEEFSADYIGICGKPSVYHPVCCWVKACL